MANYDLKPSHDGRRDMAELNPRERVQRLFMKEPVDTMPFFSGMGMALMPAIRQLGYRFPQIQLDPQKLARSAIL